MGGVWGGGSPPQRSRGGLGGREPPQLKRGGSGGAEPPQLNRGGLGGREPPQHYRGGLGGREPPQLSRAADKAAAAEALDTTLPFERELRMSEGAHPQKVRSSSLSV